MTFSKWTVAIISLLVACASASKEQEVDDNKLSIRFDKVSLEQWNDDTSMPTDKFLGAIANTTSNYCAGSDCELGTNGMSSTSFEDDDVMILSGYPVDENADVQIVFYVSLENQNKPASANQYALKKSILTTILKEKKVDIGIAVGYVVVFVGEERVGAPLDSTLNSIIIPITVGFLVLLILVTICLSYRESRNEQANARSKATEVPTNDAHGEGIVLTSVNKNSVKPQDPNTNQNTKEKKSRRPTRKKKRSSSVNRTPNEASSTPTTQYVSVHPVPAPGSDVAARPGAGQLAAASGGHSALDGLPSGQPATAVYPDLPPLQTVKRGAARSRQIAPPPSYSAAMGPGNGDDDGAAADFLGDDADEEEADGHPKRATDREHLIRPAGRLPPLDKESHGSLPSV